MKRRIMGFFLAVVIFITASLSFGGAAGQVNASPAEGMERYWVNFYRYDKDGYKEMKVMETFKVADMSPAIVFTGRSLIDEKGKDVGVYIGCKKVVTYKKLLHTNQINCSSVLIEKDLFLKYPMKDGKLHEDYACWLEILRDNRYAAGINMPLLYYRVRPGSKSGNKFNSAILNYNTYKRIGLKFTERLFYMMTYTMNGLLKYRKR